METALLIIIILLNALRSIILLFKKEIIHAGCIDCTKTTLTCPYCQYMDADWSLPDKNPNQ